MDNFMLVSVVLLWVCVVLLVLVVLAMLRQIGVLYERVAPAGALMMNQILEVGKPAPPLMLQELNGQHQIEIGGARSGDRSQLLFFLDAKCPVCKTLLPALKSARSMEKSWLDVILAGDGDEAKQKALVTEHSLGDFDFVNSEILGKSYSVSKLPYAVLIDEKGLISSMGLVNSREHLESLFEAKERGVASIQDFIQQQNTVLEVK